MGLDVHDVGGYLEGHPPRQEGIQCSVNCLDYTEQEFFLHMCLKYFFLRDIHIQFQVLV